MNAEQQVYQGLSTASAVTTLVAAKIYPDESGMIATPPMIVFERTESEPIATIHDGAPAATRVTITASAWAKTRTLADQIGDAMVNALHSIARAITRFSHVDEATGLFATVVAFEVWET